MYLVDTSVWIDYFRNIDNSATDQFAKILNQNLPFGLTSIIYQEILQGATTSQDFLQLNNYLTTQRFYHPKNNIHSHEHAAKLFYQCRRKGITIRSTIDCLITQIAIEHDLILLHNDQDYVRIKSIINDLKLA